MSAEVADVELRQRRGGAAYVSRSQARDVPDGPHHAPSSSSSSSSASKSSGYASARPGYSAPAQRGFFSHVLGVFGLAGERPGPEPYEGMVAMEGVPRRVRRRQRFPAWLIAPALLALVLVAPVFICEPEPAWDASTAAAHAKNPVLRWLGSLAGTADRPADTLPVESAGSALAACARSPHHLLPACSPVCSSLYLTRRVLGDTIRAGLNQLAHLRNFVQDKLGLGRFFRRFLALPEIPSWPLYRLGLPVLDTLYNSFMSLLPPDRRLAYNFMGFVHTAVLRAVAKLHVADHLARYAHQVRANKIASLPPAQREHYRGRESEIAVPARDLAIPLEELARRTCSFTPNLLRLLRTATQLGLFHEREDGRWEQSALSEYLRRDHPRSVKAAAEMVGGEQYVAMSSLHLSVQSGKSEFKEIYGDFWKYHEASQAEWKRFGAPEDEEAWLRCGSNEPKTYDAALDAAVSTPAQAQAREVIAAHDQSMLPYQKGPHLLTLLADEHGRDRESHEGEGASGELTLHAPRLNNVGSPIMYASPEFNKAMTSLASFADEVLAEDAHWSDVDTVVDVAGGRGHLLAEVLRRNPHISTGVVFDLPFVYSDSKTQEEVAESMTRVQAEREFSSPHGCVWATCPASHVMAGGAIPLSFASAPELTAPVVQTARNASHHRHEPRKASAEDVCANPRRAGAGASAGASFLCPAIHVTTGSFFEPDTMPRAHMFSGSSLRHKLRRQAETAAQEYFDRKFTSAGNLLSTGKDGTAAAAEKAAALAVPMPRVERPHLEHKAVYVLMQILHDWNDESSVKILQSIRHAMLHKPATLPSEVLCGGCGGARPGEAGEHEETTGGAREGKTCKGMTVEACETVLTSRQGTGKEGAAVVEVGKDMHGTKIQVEVVEPKVEYSSKLYIFDRITQKGASFINSQGANLADLLMMNNFDSAHERSVEEMQSILHAAGFRMLRVIPSRSMLGIVEAEPIV